MEYKIIIMGSICVGKTSIINRYVYNTYSSLQAATIGSSYYCLRKQDKILKLWDTGSIERYGSLMPMYYRNAHVAIVVYDVTSLSSFDKCKNIITDLQQQETMIILVANKIDLPADIDVTDGQLLANHFNILFHQCSAATGEGVNELFNLILNHLKPVQPTLQLVEVSSTCC